MNRREFLRIAPAASFFFLLPGPFRKGDSAFLKSNASQPEPFLALQGSPFRKSCDGLADYNDVPFEAKVEDIVHHRMPPEWRARMVLGITN